MKTRIAVFTCALALPGAILAVAGSTMPQPLPRSSHQIASSPYVGAERRPIKALSDDELAALRSGHGAGMAMPAELNGYPGPRHALDLADELALSAAQREQLGAAFARMHEQALILGASVIVAEADLDHAFASGAAEASQIRRLDARIGRLRAELRSTHLLAHLEAYRILSADQRLRYARLRGYASS
jgi:LTXXQ motif family protein